MRRRHSKLSRKQRRIKSRVTFRTLFLLSITLIFNTYAWFLYTTTVSTSMTAHVDAWKVEFEVDDEVVDREFTFAVAHAYPGMPDNVKELVVRNNGEKNNASKNKPTSNTWYFTYSNHLPSIKHAK